VTQKLVHEWAVGSEEQIPSDDLARYAAALSDALSAANAGKVGDWATFTEPDEWNLRSIIRVSVSDPGVGMAVLRHTLRALEVPDATWIWQWEPELFTAEIW